MLEAAGIQLGDSRYDFSIETWTSVGVGLISRGVVTMGRTLAPVRKPGLALDPLQARLGGRR